MNIAFGGLAQNARLRDEFNLPVPINIDRGENEAFRMELTKERHEHPCLPAK
jgi:hypothetical protein